MSRGLLHCLFNAENSKCSVFGLTELCANTSSDNNRYHMDLSGIKLVYYGDFSKPFLKGPFADHYYLSYITLRFYSYVAAELGVDPQADFAHRRESQGLLGTSVSCFPSGASRVLD